MKRKCFECRKRFRKKDLKYHKFDDGYKMCLCKECSKEYNLEWKK